MSVAATAAGGAAVASVGSGFTDISVHGTSSVLTDLQYIQAMDVIFTQTGTRARILCRRTDGTFTSADVGPNLPSHDFAHLIVERTLKLPSGFFVNIANGYSIQQLSEAAIINSLGPEPYVAEILARALGSLMTGACTLEQFPDLVSAELVKMGLRVPHSVSAESAARMLEELQSLLERFRRLAPGESIELQFRDAP